MMSAVYLDYEIALLLAKYGKNAVLTALATRMELSREELESLLKEMPSKRVPGRSKKPLGALDSIEQITRQHPEKAHFLRTLRARFQNRTFLPELRDVRRFFERHLRDFGAIRARAESFPRLFTLLADLDLSELDELCQGETLGEYSSLGLISDAILGQPK